MSKGRSRSFYGLLALPAALVLFGAAPAGASAADCEFAWLGGNGSGWDSADEDGDFYDGALLPVGAGVDSVETDLRDDPFDDYGIAQVDGTEYDNPDPTGCKRDGRTNRFPADEPATDIRVRPELYVPRNRAFGRQLVTLTNTGDTALTFEFAFNGDLGSDDFTVVAKTSSGNNTVNGADRWATSCEDGDADGCATSDDVGRDPELAHNWERKGKKEESADDVLLANGDSEFDVTFENVKLKPGQSKSFVEIVQMCRSIGAANKAVKAVEDGPGYLFAGLSKKERKRIQNW
jgi:hypothetical protein